MTQSAVDLIQLVGKYMFSGGGAKPGDCTPDASASDVPASPSDDATTSPQE
jgi:phospholipid/cholesterol/gamma-HCH transport system substrate-binding protein